MTLFTDKAPRIMASLLADFTMLDIEDAAAIVGNLGHESGGFKSLQELKPVVPGSRGGYGYAQWTGPRRRAYEAYCARNKLDPKSDKANYAFLFVELKGSEKRAIPAVHSEAGLNAKVVAFEKAFLRAGVKHYASRQKYAAEALAAWLKAKKPVPGIVAIPSPAPVPDSGDIIPDTGNVSPPPKPPERQPDDPGPDLPEPAPSEAGFFSRFWAWLKALLTPKGN